VITVPPSGLVLNQFDLIVTIVMRGECVSLSVERETVIMVGGIKMRLNYWGSKIYH
jgi:hypothetical protein